MRRNRTIVGGNVTIGKGIHIPKSYQVSEDEAPQVQGWKVEKVTLDQHELDKVVAKADTGFVEHGFEDVDFTSSWFSYTAQAIATVAILEQNASPSEQLDWWQDKAKELKREDIRKALRERRGVCDAIISHLNVTIARCRSTNTNEEVTAVLEQDR